MDKGVGPAARTAAFDGLIEYPGQLRKFIFEEFNDSQLLAAHVACPLVIWEPVAEATRAVAIVLWDGVCFKGGALKIGDRLLS
jgi:hypothetical protein